MFKNKKIHILVVLLCILIVSPFFSQNRCFMDDAVFHILRIEGIAQNIFNKNFLSGVSQNFLNGFGYGVGLFYSNLFLYIPAFFILLGFSSDIAYILFLILINIATFYTCFICLNNILKNSKINLYLSILYLIMPYRIINLYIRGAIGELLGLIFIPLVILGIYEIFYRNKDNYFLLVIGMVGLLHSHLLTLTIISILVLIITIVNINSTNFKEKLLSVFKSAFFSILLGSNFIFTMIEQLYSNKFYLSINKIQPNEVLFNLLNINDILKLVLNILFIFLFIYFTLKNNKKSKIHILYIFISLSTIYSIIILTNIFPWKIFYPLLKLIQFPFRLHLIFTIVLFVSFIYFYINISESDVKNIIVQKNLYYNIFIFLFLFLLTCFLTVIKFYFNINVNTTYLCLFLIFLICFLLLFMLYIKQISTKNDFIYFLIKLLGLTNCICLLFLSLFCYTNDYETNNHSLWLKSNSTYYSKHNSNYIIGKEYLPINTNLEFLNSYNINSSITNYDKYSIIEFKNNKSDWLEIPKIYYKGYKTYINNIEVKNKKSKNELVNVQTNNIESGTLKIIYKGTLLFNLTLIINFIVFIYFIFHNKSKLFNFLKVN